MNQASISLVVYAALQSLFFNSILPNAISQLITYSVESAYSYCSCLETQSQHLFNSGPPVEISEGNKTVEHSHKLHKATSTEPSLNAPPPARGHLLVGRRYKPVMPYPCVILLCHRSTFLAQLTHLLSCSILHSVLHRQPPLDWGVQTLLGKSVLPTAQPTSCLYFPNSNTPPSPRI